MNFESSVLLIVCGILLLGSSAESRNDASPPFRHASPGYLFRFPHDHGAHPEFQTEWWYYTGHLRTERGGRFGYQLTFFRRGLRPQVGLDPDLPRSRWRIENLYFAHLALTDMQDGRFRYADVISREGLGKAGAELGRLHVWINRWSSMKDEAHDAPHRLMASTPEFGISLELTATKPVVIHGRQGISRKGGGPNQASHYYSLSRLATEGAVTVEGRSMRVTGQSWMDHEFGSDDLSEDLSGWDWFGLQLQSGEELMLYRLRRTGGGVDPTSSGTWIDGTGRAQYLSADDVRVEVLDRWTSPHSRATYPARWRITIPSLTTVLDIVPSLADQELRTIRSTRITYWEGAVHVSGSLADRPASGNGYVELTGYAERFRPQF